LPEFACAGVIGLGLIFDAALVLVSSRADSPKKGNLFLRPLTFDTSASEKLEDR
jgi:hypothetical protein